MSRTPPSSGLCPERLISDGRTFSVHTYFDLCPESPDGRKVVYSRFTGGVPSRFWETPASGEVVVADRDGGEGRVVGTFAARIGHSGAYTHWIDDATVAYQDGGMLCLVDVNTGLTRRLKGGCQMYDPIQGATFCPHEVHDEGSDPLPEGLYQMNLETGAVRAVITPAMLASEPFFKALPNPPSGLWCHAKWSPSGTRMAARVDILRGPEGQEKVVGIFSCLPDGTDVKPFRYFHPDGRWGKPMHWNWYDDESYYGYDVTRPDRPCCRWALDGRLIETLHEGPGNHACLSDGRDYLVTDSWYRVNPRSVMFYRRNDRAPVVLAEMAHTWLTDAHPTLSRDGRRVYFNRTDPEGQGSQLCAVDLGVLVE